MNKYMMRCALNGADLYAISDRIYIQEIEESPSPRVDASDRPYYGQSATGYLAHEEMTVKVTFMIKERNPVYRAMILQKICAWATKGWLTVGHRIDQRMFVWCTELPSFKTFKWHEDLNIVFTAYGEACWQDVTPLTQTVSDTTEASLAAFRVRGTLPCFLEAEITNTSGSTLTSVTLSANGESISLTGLSVPDGGKVAIGYDEEHYQVITANDADAMNKRSGADDLILTPGTDNQVSCVTDVSCTTIFKARGMYR